ncbi:MAG: hypothetical protein IJ519_01055, partial [Clostridia bacterium]|nr:hypothetical protein [Clostridia bacterium]
MDNSMDALSSLLSDPAALSAAMEMAKGLLAGSGATQNPPATAEPVPPPAKSAPSMAEDDKTRLLMALKPFLSPKRSEKVGTVIALMRAMQMMGAILPHE